MLLLLHCGCKVNQYETNAMSQEFIEKGYEVVEHHEKADIYVINTCTVTNMSDRKSRQMLRRVKELNPNSIVIACGCYVQVAKDEVAKIEDIDLILGNNEKKNIVEHLEQYQKDKKRQLEIEDLMQQREFVEFGDVTYTEKTRAVVKIQVFSLVMSLYDWPLTGTHTFVGLKNFITLFTKDILFLK